LDAVVEAIKGTVSRDLIGVTRQALTFTLTEDVTAAISRVPRGYHMYGDFAEARYHAIATGVEQTTTDPDSELVLALYLRGVVAPGKRGHLPPAPEVPALPSWDTELPRRDVQMAISSWTLGTAYETFQDGGKMAGTISHTDIPAAAPVQLNTTDIAQFAPGLTKDYPHMWMQLLVGFEQGANISITKENGLSAVAPIGVRFQVLSPSGSKDVFALRLNATLAATASLVTLPTGFHTMGFEVTKIIAETAVANSTVGPVTVLAKLQGLMNLVVQSFVRPALNSQLDKGFLPLPIPANTTLSDRVLAVRPGYVIVAFNVTEAVHAPRLLSK
jgi:hypothetical protein